VVIQAAHEILTAPSWNTVKILKSVLLAGSASAAVVLTEEHRSDQPCLWTNLGMGSPSRQTPPKTGSLGAYGRHRFWL